MFRDKERDGYRVQWRENGKRRSRRFTGKNAESEAIVFEHQLRLGVADKTPSERSIPTFSDFAKRWLKDYCRVEKSETQWRHDEQTIKNHLEPALGRVRLTNLRKSHLVQLKSELRQKDALSGGRRKRKEETPASKKLSIKSVNNILALAKKIMATAVDLELIPANPFAAVRPLKLPKAEFRFWQPDERDHFLAKAKVLDPEFVSLVAVACHTGLRRGELAALRRKDLDFERRMIRVSASYIVELQKRLPTKNKGIDDVPMNEVVYQALLSKRLMAPNADVWPKELFWSVRKRLGKLAERVGVSPIRFHDLRHTFASTLAMAGVDLMVIQKLMRHKSYQMTLRYAHLHPDHLKGATDVLCRHPTGTQEDSTPKKEWAYADLNREPAGYEPLAG